MSMANSGMPNISFVLGGWESPVQLIKVEQFVNDEGFVLQQEISYPFFAVMQPLPPDERIKYDRDGQRSWAYWKMFVKNTGGVEMVINDRVTYNNEGYKVIEKLNYELNGYYRYVLIKDYE